MKKLEGDTCMGALDSDCGMFNESVARWSAVAYIHNIFDL